MSNPHDSWSLSPVDRRDLRWLEIGHYLLAAFDLLWAGFVWYGFHSMDAIFAKARATPQAAAMNDFREGVLMFGLVFQACFAVTFALVGILVRHRTGYRTCFILSIWNLLLMPFGTAAGIFTLILLRRPAIESAFRGSVTTVN